MAVTKAWKENWDVSTIGGSKYWKQRDIYYPEVTCSCGDFCGILFMVQGVNIVRFYKLGDKPYRIWLVT